jgi:uncharacterized protein (DUF427 family)
MTAAIWNGAIIAESDKTIVLEENCRKRGLESVFFRCHPLPLAVMPTKQTPVTCSHLNNLW